MTRLPRLLRDSEAASMRDEDDDDDDAQKGPSLFAKGARFLVQRPLLSGILFALLGFAALAFTLPVPEKAADAELAIAVSKVVTQEHPEQEKPPEQEARERQATPPTEETPPPAPAVPVVADVALLITDVGLNRRLAEAIDKTLPVETTLAISPYGSDPAATAKAFLDTGRDIWVNLSAQSTEAGIDPGPLAISGALSKKENVDFIKKQLDAVGSGAIGIFVPNDADITLQPDLWRDVALEAIAFNKMVLDGTAAKVATELYVQKSEAKISAYLKTDIVIDGSTPPAALEAALASAVPAILKLKEAIVVVTHPNAIGVEIVGKWVEGLAANGIRLVPASKFTGLKP
ncbi:MAG: hypothetical protein EBQ96_07975 [Proteobacteria bacterium]|nr:hypothetical protein [Pseudomonadota bacterium]